MSLGRLLSLVLLAHIATAQVPVSTPETGPAPFTRTRPRIASDGRGFLAVWTDNRAQERDGDVRAAGIDETGRALDTIVIKPSGYSAAGIASNGDGYLIASVIGIGITATTELSAISPAGAVKDGARIPSARNPALASNGRDYLLVYQAGFGPAIEQFDIYAQHLNADGSLRGERLRIAVGAIDPIVAWNGSEYAIGFFDVTGSYAAIVDDDGIRVPRVQLTAGGLQPYAARDKMSVASDGTDFLFVWAEGRGVLNSFTWKMQTFARRLRRSGELDAQQQFFPDEAPVQGDPSVAWIGDRYLVTFTSNLQRTDPDIAAVEAANDGTRLREPFTIAGLSERQTLSDVAWNGRDAEIVFVDTVRFVMNEAATKSDDIRHLRYGEAESALLSRSIVWQSAPAAVAQGDADLVLWTEQAGREHVSRLFAGRAHPAIGPLDGPGVALRISSDDQLSPALSDAPRPLAVWTELPPTGPALVYAGLPFASSEATLLGEALRTARPAVAWDGELHTVLWESPARQIVGLRVTSEGRAIGSALPLSPAGTVATDPRIVWNGERFLLSWTTFEPDTECVIIECPSRTLLNVQAVDRSFQPIAPPAVLARGRLNASRLVWNGEELAVFFTGLELTATGYHGGLRGMRVDRNGIPLDPEGRLLAAAGTAVTSAIWDGKQYVVATQTSGAPLLVRADRNLLPLSSATLDGANVAITPHGDAVDLIYQKREDVMRLQLRRWTFNEGPRRRAR